jgi:hypothetical protein
MEMRVLSSNPKVAEWPVQFDLKNATSEMGGHKFNRETMGTIVVKALPTGFFEGLTFAGQALPYSMPLLAFWLPDDNPEPSKLFPFKTPVYDGKVSFVGNARLSADDHGTRVAIFEGNVVIQGEEPDASHMRKYRGTTVLSSKDGTVLSANGKYVAQDGTVTYTIKKL